VTCHLGMALPDAGTGLFRRHPATPCRLDARQIGCTACHRGEPLGLTALGAHALGSPRELLDWRGGSRATALQPACAQCHLGRAHGVLRYDAELVPDVAAGLELFLEQGCPSCHRVAGIFAAGDHGPPLGGIGRLRRRAQLAATLADPQRQSPTSPMPPLTLPPRRAEQLVLFLSAQIGAAREPGSSPAAALLSGRRGALVDHFDSDLPTATEPNAAVGALWARRVGCTGCHRLGEDASGVPDLTRVGWIATYDELGLALRDPARRFTGTLMPRLELPEPVIGSVLLYLAQQKSPLPDQPCDVQREVCARCHGADGRSLVAQAPGTPARDRRAVVLARRPPELRGVPLQTLLEVAGRGRKGTAMAPWGRVLTESFLRQVHGCIVR